MKFFARWFGPPTEAQFAKRLAEGFRRAHVHNQCTYDAAARMLIVTNNGDAVANVNLANLYSTYRGLDRKTRVDYLSTIVIGMINNVGCPEEFEDAKCDLRPALRCRSMPEFARLEIECNGETFPGIPSIQVSEHLVACLVYDLPKSLRFVNQSDLDTWGVTIYEAMEVARQNLEENPPEVYGSFGDSLYVFECGDSYDATRMLALGMIGNLKVNGKPLALPISRDSLLITGTEDIASLSLMVALAEKGLENPRQVCSIAHILDRGEWLPWEPPADNPLRESFRRLANQYFAQVYGEQQELLQKWVEAQGRDVFIATFGGLKQKETEYSFSIWTKGVHAWLPRTELIIFGEPGVGTERPIAWERAAAVLGDMLKPIDIYPPRWEVQGYPTAEQIVEMLEET